MKKHYYPINFTGEKSPESYITHDNGITECDGVEYEAKKIAHHVIILEFEYPNGDIDYIYPVEEPNRNIDYFIENNWIKNVYMCDVYVNNVSFASVDGELHSIYGEIIKANKLAPSQFTLSDYNKYKEITKILKAYIRGLN